MSINVKPQSNPYKVDVESGFLILTAGPFCVVQYGLSIFSHIGSKPLFSTLSFWEMFSDSPATASYPKITLMLRPRLLLRSPLIHVVVGSLVPR